MIRPGTALGWLLIVAGGCEFSSGGGGGPMYWTCNDPPSQFADKTHCMTPQPPGTSTQCYFPSGGGASGAPPSATVEYMLESMAAVNVVHVRLTFDRGFVDNSYGQTAIGWGMHGHKFMDLVGSDHAELKMSDAAGAVVLDFKLDYITADAMAPSGYRNLGVSGGDGGMIVGKASSILATMTSLDRDLNERGYKAYEVDSPATDDKYTSNPAAPAWDYRVVYEAWVDVAAFGAPGFGDVKLEYVHASPSKTGLNTITVSPAPCPPNWVP